MWTFSIRGNHRWSSLIIKLDLLITCYQFFSIHNMYRFKLQDFNGQILHEVSAIRPVRPPSYYNNVPIRGDSRGGSRGKVSHKNLPERFVGFMLTLFLSCVTLERRKCCTRQEKARKEKAACWRQGWRSNWRRTAQFGWWAGTSAAPWGRGRPRWGVCLQAQEGLSVSCSTAWVSWWVPVWRLRALYSSTKSSMATSLLSCLTEQTNVQANRSRQTQSGSRWKVHS